jgi:hypothetical protein
MMLEGCTKELEGSDERMSRSIIRLSGISMCKVESPSLLPREAFNFNRRPIADYVRQNELLPVAVYPCFIANMFFTRPTHNTKDVSMAKTANSCQASSRHKSHLKTLTSAILWSTSRYAKSCTVAWPTCANAVLWRSMWSPATIAVVGVAHT